MENKKFLDLEGLEHYHNKAQQKIASIYVTNSQLNTTVNAEKSARESADSSLQSQISSVAAGSPIVVSSVSEMVDQTRIYVNTADGKWYYYDGAVWTAGGDYADGVTESVIEWYLDNIAEPQGNLLDPTACKNNTSLISTTGLEQPSTVYWITDFIPITPVLSGNGWYYLGLVSSLDDTTPTIYKVLIYDENKDIIGQATNISTRGFRSADATQATNGKYARIQFKKTAMDFDKRQNLIVTSGTAGYKAPFDKAYFYVDENNIKDSGTSIFRPDIADEFASILINNGIFPFTVNDFSYCTIATAGGWVNYDTTRLCCNRLLRVNHGVKISLTGDWTMLAMEFKSDGTYIGRYGATWSDTVSVTRDCYLKFVFRKNDANVASRSNVLDMLNNLSMSTFTLETTYYGEKIDVNNTFSTASTNLRGLHQDGASYNGIAIFCSSAGKYIVYSVDGDILKAESYIDEYTSFVPHFNSVCFGTEKFDSGDNYPLFYGNAYNNTLLPKGALYAYRLKNDYTTEYKQRIVVGFTEDPIWAGNGTNVRPYGNFVIDTDHNYLYAFTMIDSLNVTRFFKFNMPTLAQGSDITLQQSDIIEYFDVPYERYLQGCCYHNGKIYSLSGFGDAGNPALLHVIDLSRKSEVSTVPLGAMEPEAVFVNDGKIYAGQTNMRQYVFD